MKKWRLHVVRATWKIHDGFMEFLDFTSSEKKSSSGISFFKWGILYLSLFLSFCLLCPQTQQFCWFVTLFVGVNWNPDLLGSAGLVWHGHYLDILLWVCDDVGKPRCLTINLVMATNLPCIYIYICADLSEVGNLISGHYRKYPFCTYKQHVASELCIDIFLSRWRPHACCCKYNSWTIATLR